MKSSFCPQLSSRTLRGVCAAGTLLFLAADAAAQSVLYVDASYAGSTPDGSLQHPYPAIMDAVGVAAAGDTVNVLDGVYHEVVHITQPIHLEALPTATIVVQDEDVVTSTFRNVGILIDCSTNTIAPDTLVRGFTIDGADAGTQESYGILAMDHGDDFGLPASGLACSPTIEQNRIVHCDDGIFVSLKDAAPSTPSIVRNTVWPSTESLCPDGSHGIHVSGVSGSTLAASIRGNRVFGYEAGIYIDSDESGSVYVETDGNLMAFCTSGLYASLTEVVSVNDTIAFGSGDTAQSFVSGVACQTDALTLVNTLIWVPESGDGAASPCSLPAQGNGVDIAFGVPAVMWNVVTEDTVPPTYDPRFANVGAADFRLLFDSPLIDAGSALVAPGQSFPTPDDNAGAPRFADARLSASNPIPVAKVDVGAFEYLSGELTVVSAYGGGLPPEGPVSGAYVDRVYDIRQNQAFSAQLSLQGLPGDACLLFSSLASSSNVLDPVLGNFLLDPASTILASVSLDSTGSGTYFLPTISASSESSFDVQAAFVRINSAGAFDGCFSRRVRFEVNE